MKTATFKLVNEPAKAVQLFRGYSGEFEQGLVLFFALILERTKSDLLMCVHSSAIPESPHVRKSLYYGSPASPGLEDVV